MDLISILVILSALVLVLLLWLIVGYRYLNSLRKMVFARFENIDEVLRKRQDTVPLLIETVRKSVKDETLIRKLIDQRLLAAKEANSGAKKIELEHDLSKNIGELVHIGENSPELSKDVIFLEVKNDLRLLGAKIEKHSNEYNEIVRRYNGAVNSFIMRPLALIFGFRDLQIFEFEDF